MGSRRKGIKSSSVSTINQVAVCWNCTGVDSPPQISYTTLWRNSCAGVHVLGHLMYKMSNVLKHMSTAPCSVLCSEVCPARIRNAWEERWRGGIPPCLLLPNKERIESCRKLYFQAYGPWRSTRTPQCCAWILFGQLYKQSVGALKVAVSGQVPPWHL